MKFWGIAAALMYLFSPIGIVVGHWARWRNRRIGGGRVEDVLAILALLYGYGSLAVMLYLGYPLSRYF